MQLELSSCWSLSYSSSGYAKTAHKSIPDVITDSIVSKHENQNSVNTFTRLKNKYIFPKLLKSMSTMTSLTVTSIQMEGEKYGGKDLLIICEVL